MQAGHNWRMIDDTLEQVPGWMPTADSYPVWLETILTEAECDAAFFNVIGQYHRKQLSTVYQWDGKGSQVDLNARYTHYYDIKELTNHQYVSDVLNASVQRIIQQWTGQPYATTSALYSHQILGYEERCLFRTHADNSINSGGWSRNTPERDFSAILYLSDNVDVVTRPNQFSGGELVLDNILWNDEVITVRPKKGQLLVFPSHPMYIHQVRPVTRGYRVAIVNWYQVHANQT